MTRLPIPGSDDNTWGTVLNDFLSVDHNADGTLKASGSLDSRYVPSVVMAGSGIDATGATDSTTAMQAIITNAPRGARIIIPAGIYTFSSLTITAGKQLVGSGWNWLRDGVGLFGDSNYASSSIFGGTVLRSTATSGSAIQILPANNTQGNLADFILIGPGSGTSTGVTSGSASRAIINAVWFNVAVCNFATGIDWIYLEDSTLNSVAVRGCTTGVKLETNTNNNAFVQLDIERCVNGLIDDTTCINNAFFNIIGQANTGTSVTFNGISQSIHGGYFENTGATRAIDIANGNGNAVLYVQLTKTTDGIRVQSAAHNTQIMAPTAAAAIPIDNAGVSTLLTGDFQTSFTLTDTGTRTIVLNTGLGQISGTNAVIGTNSGTSSTIDINGATATARQVRFYTANVARYLFRVNGAVESGSNAGSNFEIVARDDGGASLWTTAQTRSTGDWSFPAAVSFAGNTSVSTAGKGLLVKEGSNAKQGTATLSSGTVTVANTSVTASSRIFLTVQSLGTVSSPKTVAVTARVVGTSFTITSADNTDTSVVAYEIFEPA